VNGFVLTIGDAVTPSTVRQLLDKGFEINVERSPARIFDEKEFEDVPGVTMVPIGSWPDAPESVRFLFNRVKGLVGAAADTWDIHSTSS